VVKDEVSGRRRSRGSVAPRESAVVDARAAA
jgi:hypothetical protein